MTLKIKRNIPIVILLVGILSILALTMGNQQIISYTVNTEALQTVQLGVITDDLAQLNGLFSAQDSQFNTMQP